MTTGRSLQSFLAFAAPAPAPAANPAREVSADTRSLAEQARATGEFDENCLAQLTKSLDQAEKGQYAPRERRQAWLDNCRDGKVSLPAPPDRSKL